MGAGVSNGFDPLELAELAIRLRLLDPPTRVDGSGYQVQTEPRFELRAKERRELAAGLIAAGHTDISTARRLGISRTSWWRYRGEVEQRGNEGLTPYLSPVLMRLRVSKKRDPRV